MFKTMIVDDEYDIREGLKTIVDWEKQGFFIVGEASDGLEALEAYEKEKVNLVVTDIRMPEMDGATLSKELKKRNPDIKILILSGYSDFKYAKEAIKYGVDAYLLKPVDQNELCTELEKIRNEIMEDMLSKRKARERIVQLKDYFLNKLVHGELHDGYGTDAAEYGIDLECRSFCLLIGEIPDDKTNSGRMSKDLDIERFSVRNVIEEIINEKNSGYIFESNPHQLGILVTAKTSILNSGKISDIKIKISDCVKKYLKVDFAIGTGEIVDSVNDISKSYKTALLSLETYNGKESGGADKNIDAVLKYIHTHYGEELNLKILSSMFYHNPVYLGQLFKKETGEYFHEYINGIRVENAKRLMEDGILSINRISEKVGYKNIEHFYKIFKRVTGYSPSEYIKKYSN